jgi:hypothetical protein
VLAIDGKNNNDGGIFTGKVCMKIITPKKKMS